MPESETGNNLLDLLEKAETRKFTRLVNNTKHQISEYVFFDESQQKLAWTREDLNKLVVDGKENFVFFVPIIGVSLAEARVQIADHYDHYWQRETENGQC